MIINNKDIKRITYTGNTFFVKWYTNTWCNFHCPYCFQDNSLIFKDSQEELEKKAEYINKLLFANDVNIKFKGLDLRLIGGECTIYDLTKLIDKFELPIKRLGITTNFSRSIDYFKNLYEYCKSKNILLILNCSYHLENKNFFDKMLELSDWCKQNNFRIPDTTIVLGKDFDITKLLKYIDLGLSKITVKTQRRPDGTVDEDSIFNVNLIKEKLNIKNSKIGPSGQYEIELMDNNRIYLNAMTQFCSDLDLGGLVSDGRLCNSGINSIFIYPEGDIYRGCCPFLHQKSKCIGNIFDLNFRLPKNEILCKSLRETGKIYRCTPAYHISLSEVKDLDLYEESCSKILPERNEK